MQTNSRQAPRTHGFTMIELMVVLAMIGLLLSIAVPQYIDALERGREQALAHNVAQLRKAIDQFYADRGSYPSRLDDLVERRYLRALPENPFTQAVDWETVSPPAGANGGVYDIVEPVVPRRAAVPREDAAASQADFKGDRGGAGIRSAAGDAGAAGITGPTGAASGATP
jgi:general secretion pathway protein G